MGSFQTAMGKLVTGEGSKKRNSAQRAEFDTGMKTVRPGNQGLRGTEDARREASGAGVCVGGRGGHRSLLRKLELAGDPADSASPCSGKRSEGDVFPQPLLWLVHQVSPPNGAGGVGILAPSATSTSPKEQ